MSDLLKALEQTRKGYREECVWHKFLMDAYLGTGGFSGGIKQPVSGFWGPAAEAYSQYVVGRTPATTIDTYIDRFGREDTEKFRSRVQATTYYNYVETLTDLKVSYIRRKPLEFRDIPDVVEAWNADVDGHGMTRDELRTQLDIRAAVLGWCPLLIDARPTPVDDEGNTLDLTRAQAAELRLQPYPVPLFPSQLLDYDLDDAGQLTFAKIKSSSTRRDSWDQEPVTVDTYTVWTATEWTKYEVIDQDAREVGGGPNPFGTVPLVIWRHKPAPNDPIKGMPMHAAPSIVARSLLNRTSEYVEHLRGQVFAVLVYAAKGGQMPADVTVGTDNALVVDSDGSQSHDYIAPPASVAETYEKRLEADVREMYRLARVEFTRQSGQATSGLSRAYEFAQTNRALADFAAEIAKAEATVDDLVGRYYGVPIEERQAAQVIAPQSFDVEDLTTDIQNGLDLISANIGPTATNLVKMQLIDSRLRNLDPDTRAIIESELDDESALDAAVDRFDDEGPLAGITVGSPESEADDDITTELEAGA